MLPLLGGGGTGALRALLFGSPQRVIRCGEKVFPVAKCRQFDL